MKKIPSNYPKRNRIRVIADTDAYCECDDQYAIAHLLMTPEFDIKAFISELYGSLGGQDGNQLDWDPELRSYEEIHNIVDLMGLTGEVNILHGGKHPLTDEKTPVESEGARFIVEEAMRDDPRPLFVVSQGAITNLASAYLMEPGIAEKVTAIWIGGGVYPKGGWEYNLCNDYHAANVIFQSNMELWQVPINVYTTMGVSFFELMEQVYPYGEIGKYLVENTFRTAVSLFPDQMLSEDSDEMMSKYKEMISPLYNGAMPTRGEMATGSAGQGYWSLGDSPVIGLMINNRMGKFEMMNAPTVSPNGAYQIDPDNSRKIKVYQDIDAKFILNDMFAKLKYFFG